MAAWNEVQGPSKFSIKRTRDDGYEYEEPIDAGGGLPPNAVVAGFADKFGNALLVKDKTTGAVLGVIANPGASAMINPGQGENTEQYRIQGLPGEGQRIDTGLLEIDPNIVNDPWVTQGNPYINALRQFWGQTGSSPEERVTSAVRTSNENGSPMFYAGLDPSKIGYDYLGNVQYPKDGGIMGAVGDFLRENQGLRVITTGLGIAGAASMLPALGNPGAPLAGIPEDIGYDFIPGEGFDKGYRDWLRAIPADSGWDFGPDMGNPPFGQPAPIQGTPSTPGSTTPRVPLPPGSTPGSGQPQPGGTQTQPKSDLQRIRESLGLASAVGSFFSGLNPPSQGELSQALRGSDAARRQYVAANRKQIEDAFRGFDDSYYDSIANAYKAYASPEVGRVFDDAERSVIYRAPGGVGSSAFARNLGKVQGDRQRAFTAVGEEAQNEADRIRSGVEGQRSSLLGQAEASEDPALFGEQAIAAAKASSQAPSYSPLADLFSRYANMAVNAGIAERQGYGRSTTARPLLFGGGGGGSGGSSVRVVG